MQLGHNVTTYLDEEVVYFYDSLEDQRDIPAPLEVRIKRIQGMYA